MFYVRELVRFFVLLFDSVGECKLKDNMIFEVVGIFVICINQFFICETFFIC